ncbi:hypothetical protein T484DRAFT_1755647 [Baffinella frigidus]|nr:hypothetical protein T484DRAFT_1755647 [Cryptophyta sp. CCMP2293]
MDPLRSRSTYDNVAGSHRSQNTTAPDAPNRLRSPRVLVRAETYPRGGSHLTPIPSVASFWRSQPMSLEQGRRHSATNGTIRQPCRRLSLPNGLVEGRLASCPETSTSLGSTPPSSPRRTLKDVRNAARTKQTEKIVQARAVMKRRLADYAISCEQRAQSADAAA